MLFRKVFWLWSPVVGMVGLIFLVSSNSSPPRMPEGLSHGLIHGLSYCVLAMFILRALASGDCKRVTLVRMGCALALSILYGLTDEFHQMFVPGRVADVYDLLADTVGAIIGLFVVWTWSRFLRMRHSL